MYKHNSENTIKQGHLEQVLYIHQAVCCFFAPTRHRSQTYKLTNTRPQRTNVHHAGQFPLDPYLKFNYWTRPNKLYLEMSWTQRKHCRFGIIPNLSQCLGLDVTNWYYSSIYGNRLLEKNNLRIQGDVSIRSLSAIYVRKQTPGNITSRLTMYKQNSEHKLYNSNR